MELHGLISDESLWKAHPDVVCDRFTYKSAEGVAFPERLNDYSGDRVWMIAADRIEQGQYTVKEKRGIRVIHYRVLYLQKEIYCEVREDGLYRHAIYELEFDAFRDAMRDMNSDSIVIFTKREDISLEALRRYCGTSFGPIEIARFVEDHCGKGDCLLAVSILGEAAMIRARAFL